MAAVDSMLVFPPDPYVDILTPSVMGFGGEQVTRVGPLGTGSVPLEGEARQLASCPCSLPWEDTTTRPSANQEEHLSSPDTNLPAPCENNRLLFKPPSPRGPVMAARTKRQQRAFRTGFLKVGGWVQKAPLVADELCLHGS